VIHHDHILPYLASSNSIPWTYHSSHSDHTINTPSNPNPSITVIHDDDDHPPPLTPSDPTLLAPKETTPSTTHQLPSSPVPILEPVSTSSSVPTHNSHPTPSLRRSTRQSNKPSHLSDYVCNLSASSSTPTSSGTFYPLSAFHSYSNLSNNFEKYAMSITATVEPRDYKQASQHQCWLDAMDAEIRALQQNRTWTYVDLPANTKPIGCKWVYKVKHKADGTIERYKARLVAKGYTQIE
ncbi:retrovirus-related pol polyprotein from transposon TNT 1-94, partial [Trifolium medium]|nr:retrovirus-related pol polyprotein from transposon TNT 1-94 [Trifolium medium]